MNIQKAIKKIGLTKKQIIDLMQVSNNCYKSRGIPISELETRIEINDIPIVISEIDEHNIVIAFRGTATNAEWVDNFKTWGSKSPIKSVGGRVHYGFKKRFEKIKPWLIKYLSSKLYLETEGENSKRINLFFTGHSLGATTALYSALFTEIFSDQFNVYSITFASPRPGNWKFRREAQKLLKNKIMMVKNGKDIVCSVPFLIFFYRHVGLYSTIGKWSIKKIFLAYTLGWFSKAYKYYERVQDHYPEAYVNNLSKDLK